MITFCSFIYNGEDDALTNKAKKFVEKCRNQLKTQINCNKEKNIQQFKTKQFTISNSKTNLFGFSES